MFKIFLIFGYQFKILTHIFVFLLDLSMALVLIIHENSKNWISGLGLSFWFQTQTQFFFSYHVWFKLTLNSPTVILSNFQTIHTKQYRTILFL
jgi:hypothetical protein